MNESNNGTPINCSHCGYETQWGLLACRGCGARMVYRDGSASFFRSLIVGFVVALTVAGISSGVLPSVFKTVPIVSHVAAAYWEFVHGDSKYEKAHIWGPIIPVSEEAYEAAWVKYRKKQEAYRKRENERLSRNRTYVMGSSKNRERSPIAPLVTTNKRIKQAFAEYGLMELGWWFGLFVFWKVTKWSMRPKFKEEIEFVRYYPRN